MCSSDLDLLAENDESSTDEESKGFGAIIWTLLGIVLSFMLGRIKSVTATTLGFIFQKYPGLLGIARNLLRVTRLVKYSCQQVEDLLERAHVSETRASEEDADESDPEPIEKTVIYDEPVRESTGATSVGPSPTSIRDETSTRPVTANSSRSPMRRACPVCRKPMKRYGQEMHCTGYPLCHQVVPVQEPMTTNPSIDAAQALNGTGGPREFPSWASPSAPPAPRQLSSEIPPTSAWPYTPPRASSARPVATPTDIFAELGGVSLERGRSPTHRHCCQRASTTRTERVLTANKQAEASLAFETAITQPCPKCGRSDKLSRQGSSHLIENLRCNRCQIRIAWRHR